MLTKQTNKQKQTWKMYCVEYTKSNSTGKKIYLKGSVQWFIISQIEFQSKYVPWQSSFWFLARQLCVVQAEASEGWLRGAGVRVHSQHEGLLASWKYFPSIRVTFSVICNM